MPKKSNFHKGYSFLILIVQFLNVVVIYVKIIFNRNVKYGAIW